MNLLEPNITLTVAVPAEDESVAVTHVATVLGAKYVGYTSSYDFDAGELTLFVFTDGTETPAERDAVLDFQYEVYPTLSLDKEVILGNGIDAATLSVSTGSVQVLVDNAIMTVTDTSPIVIRSHTPGTVKIRPATGALTNSLDLDVMSSVVSYQKGGNSLVIGAPVEESWDIVLPITSVQVCGEDSWKPISEDDFSLTFDVALERRYVIVAQYAIQKVNGNPTIGFDFAVDVDPSAFTTPYQFGKNMQMMKVNYSSNAVVRDSRILTVGTHRIVPMWKVDGGKVLLDGRLSEISFSVEAQG